MASAPTADQLFFTNTEFQVLLCRKREHGVRRDNISSHLTGTHHRIPHSMAISIEQCIQQWDHIEDQPDISQWPTQVDRPIVTGPDVGLILVIVGADILIQENRGLS
jgi:hypothetical protein